MYGIIFTGIVLRKTYVQDIESSGQQDATDSLPNKMSQGRVEAVAFFLYPASTLHKSGHIVNHFKNLDY